MAAALKSTCKKINSAVGGVAKGQSPADGGRIFFQRCQYNAVLPSENRN